jgi:hypothetical protein
MMAFLVAHWRSSEEYGLWVNPAGTQSSESERFRLTGRANFDSLKKFAQKCSATSSRAAAMLRFPDPSGPLRRLPAWIFDNQVEHASRENGRRSWFDHSHKLDLHDLSSIMRAIAPATSVDR